MSTCAHEKHQCIKKKILLSMTVVKRQIRDRELAGSTPANFISIA